LSRSRISLPVLKNGTHFWSTETWAPVRDYRLHDRFSDLPFLHAAAALALNAAGFSTLARGFGDVGTMQAIDRLNLDGLLALWHPATAN